MYVVKIYAVGSERPYIINTNKCFTATSIHYGKMLVSKIT